ncbi:hypothetical protein FACS189499_06760 [Clostridia bacterium]|nr:hypothetical protein FACS189499_06760 [Clostridia bacterium]
MLEWSIGFTPSRTNINTDDSYSQFSLDEIDFSQKISNSVAEQPKKIIGNTLITPHAVEHLGDMLNQISAQYTVQYPGLADVVKKIANMNALSQRLDGYHDKLLMLKHQPQLPIFTDDNNMIDLVKRMTAFVQQGNMLTPDVDQNANAFVPIPAGISTVDVLWVVDSFGQYNIVCDLDKPLKLPPIISESLKCFNDDKSSLSGPRFLQPVRLDFRWLSINGDIVTVDSGNSPIYGFVSPNFLDLNLQVYDSDGNFLGLLQESGNSSLWLGQKGYETIDKIPSRVLQSFLSGIFNKPYVLTDLLGHIDDCAGNFSPYAHNTFFQSCFGNVLVLSKADISVTALGNSLHAQLWTPDFNADNGYTNEQFEIKIGDGRNFMDSMVGFFTDTFNTMYTSVSYNGKTNYLNDNNAIKTSLKNNPVPLTILFDPTGTIMLHTGFTPAREVALSSMCFEKTIKQMESYLRVAPVLSAIQDFKSFVPATDNDWAFEYVGEDGVSKRIDKILDVDVNLPISRQTVFEGQLIAERDE